jgi:hypothetical protein
VKNGWKSEDVVIFSFLFLPSSNVSITYTILHRVTRQSGDTCTTMPAFPAFFCKTEAFNGRPGFKRAFRPTCLWIQTNIQVQNGVVGGSTVKINRFFHNRCTDHTTVILTHIWHCSRYPPTSTNTDYSTGRHTPTSSRSPTTSFLLPVLTTLLVTSTPRPRSPTPHTGTSHLRHHLEGSFFRTSVCHQVFPISSQ